MVIFLILFVILAIANIINPAIGWYLRYGWAVKGDSEPSEFYLMMSRIGSIVGLVFVLYILFSGAIPL